MFFEFIRLFGLVYNSLDDLVTGRLGNFSMSDVLAFDPSISTLSELTLVWMVDPEIIHLGMLSRLFNPEPNPNNWPRSHYMRVGRMLNLQCQPPSFHKPASMGPLSFARLSSTLSLGEKCLMTLSGLLVQTSRVKAK